MTDQEFRARMTLMGFNQSSFARRMIELGDPRSFATLLRSISNQARGATRVPPEMDVILTLVERDNGARSPGPALKRGRPRKLAASG